MAIASLKPIELWMRRVFLRILAGRSRKQNNIALPLDPKSILILRQDRLGDVLMSTFFLVALREKFPKARMVLLLGKNNIGVKPLLPFDVETVVYSKNFFEDSKLVRSLGKQHFDVAIDMTDKASVTSSILLSQIKAKVSVGVEKQNSAVYDITVPAHDQLSVHITERVSELLRPFGIDPVSVDRSPKLKLEAQKIAGRVGLNVSARQADRSAPPAAAAQIAQGLLDEGFSEIIVFAAPHDQERGDETVRLANDPRVKRAENAPTFEAFAKQVVTCEYLVTVDTSISQIAAAVGIPMVLLFKPMFDERPWTPAGVPFEIHTQHPSLAALEPQPVLALFRRLVERTSAHSFVAS